MSRDSRLFLPILLVVTGTICLPSLSGQTVTITPTVVLRDQTAVIRVTGLEPHQQVAIQANLIDGEGQHWTSQGDFISDLAGEIDLSRQAPIRGSYKDVSSMGLVWSMKPLEKGVTQYKPPRNFGSQRIQFQVLSGGNRVAEAELEQKAIGAEVKQIKIEGQLHGILFSPVGPGQHPGLLVLGGSEGGLPMRRAALLASHGYSALALAYFRYENLPKELAAIPLEYFGEAIAWMKQRPEVLPDHIGVVGVSRGGELALQLGSMYPSIKAVVAYVPANVRYRSCCSNGIAPYAWTWKGWPLAFVRRDQAGLEALDATIRVEATHGGLLLIGGEGDKVWNSAEMVRHIVSRLKQAHFQYEIDALIYAQAGHTAGRPDILPEWHGMLRHPVSGRATDPGGTPEGNARSSLDAIPKVLDFLGRNLSAAP